jgi:hypothetical protein
LLSFYKLPKNIERRHHDRGGGYQAYDDLVEFHG